MEIAAIISGGKAMGSIKSYGDQKNSPTLAKWHELSQFFFGIWRTRARVSLFILTRVLSFKHKGVSFIEEERPRELLNERASCKVS